MVSFARGYRLSGVERHNPAVQYVQKGMVSGQYGRVMSILAKRVSSFPGRARDAGAVLDREGRGSGLTAETTEGRLRSADA